MYKIINLGIAFFFVTAAYAQTNVTVTSLSDNASTGTLRWAINTANADANVNEIVFATGLSGTLTLTANLPNITSNLTVIGPGVSNLIISGNAEYTMFKVVDGSVLTISGITFSYNKNININNNINNNKNYYGSIFRADNNNSSVVASSISVTNNDNNYAFFTFYGSTITVTNSTFTNNKGRIFGSDDGSTPTTTSDIESDYTNRITVVGSTFSSNEGTIFYTERYVKIDNCIFTNNSGTIGEFRGFNRYQVLNSTFTDNNKNYDLELFLFFADTWGDFSTLGTNQHLFNGNTFIGNNRTIINPGGNNYQDKTTITNNTFTNNKKNWKGTPIVVSGNTFDNFITSVSHSSINKTIVVTMSRPVFNTNAGSGALDVGDFQFELSGGNAILGSSTPTSISVSDNTYILGLNTIGNIDGTEIITVKPVLNSIYDATSGIAGLRQNNNTVILNILDDDLDGVPNYQDSCPNTNTGVVVEPANGCADVTAPITPTDFNITIGTYKLVLNWTKNTDDTIEYRLYGGTNQNSLSLIGTLSSNSTSYNHTNLAANTIYYYKIIAKDLAGNTSIPSTIISASPKKPLIWNGSKITFDKNISEDGALIENQDFITENVILTGDGTNNLFNSVSESSYTYNQSPVGTEWARGTTANLNNLNFRSMNEATWGCPSCNINTDFVIHLITDDIYIDIKLLSWSDDTFSYKRGTLNPLSGFDPITKTSYDDPFTIATPVSESTGAFTYVSSDTNVATISGTTVTIVGVGVTIITATQEADDTHSAYSISADLTVNGISILTKYGEISNTNTNYVNKYGAIETERGVSANGEIKAIKTMSIVPFNQLTVSFYDYFDFETGSACGQSCFDRVPANYDLKFAAGSGEVRARMWWNQQYANMALVYDKSFSSLTGTDILDYYFCDYVGDGNASCINVDTPPTNFVGIYQTNEGNYYAVQYLSEDSSGVTFKYKRLN